MIARDFAVLLFIFAGAVILAVTLGAL